MSILYCHINSMLIYQFYNLNYPPKKHIKFVLNVFFVNINIFNFRVLIVINHNVCDNKCSELVPKHHTRIIVELCFLTAKILQFVWIFAWSIGFLVKVIAQLWLQCYRCFVLKFVCQILLGFV